MNNINDLQEQFENLIKQGQELLEKMKENQNADVSKKVERWKPNDGGTYWIITANGEVEWQPWDGSKWDMGCYKLHNCFKTKEEAQKELDRRLAEQELLDMCDWQSGDIVEIYFRSIGGCFAPTVLSPCIASPYHFATKESAQKAIDTLGTEKLKLIFRI